MAALSVLKGVKLTRASVTSLASPGGALEPVQFSGDLSLHSLFAVDLDFGKHSFGLLIDLKGIVGVGKRSGTRYVLTSQESLVLPMAAHQKLEFTFPMATGPDAPISSMRTGVAQLVMNVDPASGTVTALAASLRAE